MTDEATAEKFDRWWTEHGRKGDDDKHFLTRIIRGASRDAFMAGAAAERAEHLQCGRCFVLDVDGEPVRIQGDSAMSDESRDAVADLVRTVRQLTPEQVKALQERKR